MKYWIFALLLALALTGCGGGATTQTGDILLTDSLGNELYFEEPPKRVAALLGSYAEVWLLAGGEDALAAVTHDAYEERGLNLPETVTDLGQSHQPNLELLLAAQPDLVLLTPDLEGQLKLKDSLEGAGVPTAWFKVETFSDYLTMLEELTGLTGRADLYEQNGLAVQAQIDRAKGRATGEAPDILLLRAYSSNVKAKNSDNTAGAMLRDMGCVNVADSETGLLEELQLEAILRADPEHIFVVTMGADSGKALENVQNLLESDPAWGTLAAVKGGNVHILDKALFHYKPNARWGESYEVLADILYPAQ